MLCQINSGPQFQNFTFNVAFLLGAWPQKIWTVTQKWANIEKKFLEPALGCTVMSNF